MEQQQCNCPTKEQVLKAAKTDPKLKVCLKQLFPQYFAVPLAAGDIYQWGRDATTGLLVEANGVLSLVDLFSGKTIFDKLTSSMTSLDLGAMIRTAANDTENQYGGVFREYTDGIVGPKTLKSIVAVANDI